jgi:UDP-N-acetyl-2-amino-2-deoxyglucuronate dehydrogenase
MTVGFGIVGCGMIANFHAKAIEQIRGAKIVACTDNVLPAAERFAGTVKCRVHQSVKDLCADPAVDIVTICTPSGAHRDPAVAAANSGKHVIVEKPLEITLKRCDAIIDACRKNKVLLATIFPSRFSEANLALKEAITAGRFGRLTLADTYVKWWRTQQYYDSGGWRGTWALDGGGAYMNQAIHNVDLLYWFLGDVAEVAGVTATLGHERIEVEDVGVAALRFANGALGVIEATTSAYPGLLKKTEIHGTQGSVIAEQDDILLWSFEKPIAKDAAIPKRFAQKVGGTGGASDPSAISFVGHQKQIQDFATAIKKGRKPLVEGEEGRKSVEIILAIYKSSWTGRRVPLPLAADPVIPKSLRGKSG